MSHPLTPREIVCELDRFIIGQRDAKRCVANALRNRWRRMQVSSPLREEIYPKNILMMGPTGVGKTEIARRMARLVQAPFIKVEATKFTEVGYVGRDVEQMIRDLVEVSLANTRKRLYQEVQKEAEEKTFKRLLKALIGEASSPETRVHFTQRLEDGLLESYIVEIEVQLAKSSPWELPPGIQVGMVQINDMLKSFGEKTKTKRLTIAQARKILMEEESEKLLDPDQLTREALEDVEHHGIIFIDEIDKICEESRHGKVSREGVQRDLIPLLEGSSVPTKHGLVKTDHILFIASGAFHVAKPSDLLPELQGRLPLRVELEPLTEEEFYRILTEPETNLIVQYQALLAIEGLTLTFLPDAIRCIARMAVQVNTYGDNTGARRLHTLLEKILEDLSFEAPSCVGQTIIIDEEKVLTVLAPLAKDPDLSRFIL